MEISNDYSGDSYYSVDNREEDSSDVIGKIALINVSLVAFSAFVPAVFKKKRAYIIQSTAPSPNAPAPAPAFEMPDVQPAQEDQGTYDCAVADKTKIASLFTDLSDNCMNPVYLAWHSRDLKQRGEEIKHVHTFAFLAALPKDKMKIILNSMNVILINEFITNTSNGITKEQQRGNIDRHIPAFADQVGKDADQIKRLILARDWTGLVHYLFDVFA